MTSCAYTVSVFAGWVPIFPGMQLMQNILPDYVLEFALEELQECDITIMSWPVYPFYIYPIEMLYQINKHQLEKHCLEMITFDQVWAAVNVIRNAILVHSVCILILYDATAM